MLKVIPHTADKMLFAEAGLIHNYGNLQMKNILHAIEKNGEMDIDRILES